MKQKGGVKMFPYQNNNYPMPQRYEIIHVNGENGARALAMLPNSNVILLDDTDSLIWVAQTDGGGYKTVTPYKIEPYVKEQPIDLKTLEDRIMRIEERLNESNTTNTKSKQTTEQHSSKTSNN